MFNFFEIAGFDWNQGNINKNWEKHKVDFRECEEVFLNKPLLILFDEKHSEKEIRFFSLGKTDKNRLLFLVFTTRKNKIRIISARIMSNKEKKIYEQTKD